MGIFKLVVETDGVTNGIFTKTFFCIYKKNLGGNMVVPKIY